jgi:2,4-dienoyl-CoA reductase-like NADH-dependent reductase (Old Yellow Enzyme family)
MLKFPKLFEPVKVGGVIFRNRIFGSPTGSMDFNSDHTPTEDWIAYYERKAMGAPRPSPSGNAISIRRSAEWAE